MIIEPFCKDDIAGFLALAAEECWVAEPWEFKFLLSAFSQGCFAAREEDGATVGFVTSLRHERSGWIGNLIVSPECRGRGIGEALFRAAQETLLDSGVETVWLTASKEGQLLYQKCGFTRIDTVIRWNSSGRQRCSDNEVEVVCNYVDPLLKDIDSRAWGDQRTALLAVTAGRGNVLQQESGFVMAQPAGGDMQLGPFSAPGYSTAEVLLKRALSAIPSGTKVCLDAPASNRTAMQLFNRNRMRISGSNELMYAGVKPAYRPELIYGLATMGSCG